MFNVTPTHRETLENAARAYGQSDLGNALRALLADHDQQRCWPSDFADAVCLRVAELPNRTSPDDWPEAMLVTANELELIIVNLLSLEPVDQQEARGLLLNGWIELGEEMGRIISAMSPEQAEDLLPDWFGPRLFDMQIKGRGWPKEETT